MGTLAQAIWRENITRPPLEPPSRRRAGHQKVCVQRRPLRRRSYRRAAATGKTVERNTGGWPPPRGWTQLHKKVSLVTSLLVGSFPPSRRRRNAAKNLTICGIYSAASSSRASVHSLAWYSAHPEAGSAAEAMHAHWTNRASTARHVITRERVRVLERTQLIGPESGWLSPCCQFGGQRSTGRERASTAVALASVDDHRPRKRRPENCRGPFGPAQEEARRVCRRRLHRACPALRLRAADDSA